MAKSTIIPTPGLADVVTLTILSEGKELPGHYLLMSAVVVQEVNRIPYAKLTLLDGEASEQEFQISDKNELIPGKKIEIKAGYKSNTSTIFKGIVITHSLKIRAGDSYLMVECRDEAVKMTLDRKSEYYEDQKDSDIIEQIIGNYGLQKNVETTSVKHKELVQFDTTDWDFIVSRAEVNGKFCVVDNGKVNIAKPDFSQSAVLTASFGNSILEFDVEMDARHQFNAVKSIAWSAADQAMVEASGNEPTPNNQGNLSTSAIGKAVDVKTFTMRHTGAVPEPELQAWADAKLLRQRMAKTYGRVKFQGFANLKPAMMINLDGVGARFSGDVFVSAVRHEIAKGNWLTDAQFGLHPEWFAQTFDLTPLPAAGLLPPVGGLQIGIVTKLENDPDGEDRIMVRLPIIDPNHDGIWARIATLDAGDKRGSFFRPELNDEVVVGFLNNDPRYAVVIGMCHSSAKPAPHQPKDDNHEKGFVTRSEMKIWFDDDKKVMTISTPAGNKIELSEDATSITLEDQNKNKIVLDADGILIESAKHIVLKATKDIKMEGVNIEAKASANFKAEASAGATMKASATATVEGSASTTIKGGIVQIN